MVVVMVINIVQFRLQAFLIVSKDCLSFLKLTIMDTYFDSSILNVSFIEQETKTRESSKNKTGVLNKHLKKHRMHFYTPIRLFV